MHKNINEAQKQCTIHNVIARFFTAYKIKRVYSNKTQFFFVNVKEAKQYGIGFQINIKGALYGFSIHS